MLRQSPLRFACAAAFTAVIATASAADSLVGKTVPPYPAGLDELQGSCISGGPLPAQVCDYSLTVVGRFAADRAQGATATQVLAMRNLDSGARQARWIVTGAVAVPKPRKGYELQIAKDPAFVEVVLQTRVPTPAYRWEQLPSVTHWWRVRSFDGEGRPSEWSQPRTVALESTVPVPKLPADEALLPCAQSVELSFEASPLIKEFLVEVSTSKDFAPARQLTSKSPNVSLGTLSAGTWFWRAKALDVRGRTGESTGARKFTIRPAAPKIAKPAADVVLGAPTVTLSWGDVACAVSWVVEASTDTKDKVSLVAKTSSLGFKPNAAGEYRWRVAAVDERGTPGEWSQESVFKVRLATPTPRGESSTPLKLDLAWTPVIGATQYRIEIASERDFKQVLSSGTVTGSQFRVDGGMLS